jgi:hypothetical protein
MIEANDRHIHLRCFLGRYAEETAATTTAATAAQATATTTATNSLLTATATTAGTTAAAAASTAATATSAATGAAKLGSHGNARKCIGQLQVERLLCVIRNDQLGFVIVQGDELRIDLAGIDGVEEVDSGAGLGCGG